MMRRLASLAVILALLAALAGCGSSKLSGTYSSQDGFGQSFTFDGDSVTMSAFGLSAQGTYKLTGGNIEITYELLGMSNTWTQSFSKSGSSIYIGGTEFTKDK